MNFVWGILVGIVLVSLYFVVFNDRMGIDNNLWVLVNNYICFLFV